MCLSAVERLSANVCLFRKSLECGVIKWPFLGWLGHPKHSLGVSTFEGEWR